MTTDRGRWGRIPAWWLDHPDLDADGLAVLAALSTYADEEGTCWPSQATLAGKLKRSRSTVNRLIGRLQEIGMLTVERRSAGDGGRLSSLYRLRLSPPDAGHDTGVVAADSPRSAARQEQPHPKQIPDSPDAPERLRTVPADWVPSADDLAWAASRCSDIDLKRHVEGFVLRCRAHGYRYRDIGAAWRAWLVEDTAGKAREKAPASRGKPPAAEQRVAAWSRVAGRLTELVR